jgi:HEAT repeat protein
MGCLGGPSTRGCFRLCAILFASDMQRKPSNRVSKSAAPSRGFDAELDAFEVLRHAPIDTAAIEHLRKALGHRNNFVVSKAAKIIEENVLAALLSDVLAAYDRFFEDAEKSDPQCWAKNALVKALVKLEHREKAAYLRGLKHHQMEGAWGGASDTAGTLRGACAHALVNCPGVPDQELLSLFVELFADADKAVRVEAARAIANVGGPSAVLLLRLRALLGKDEPEVLGACYAWLLDLEGRRAIGFVARYLEEGDDNSAEAAFALSGLREPEALKALMARRREFADDWFDGVLLSAIASSRLPEAAEYLVGVIERDERGAAAAIEAMGRAAPNEEMRERVEQAVRRAGSPRLEKALREQFEDKRG